MTGDTSPIQDWLHAIEIKSFFERRLFGILGGIEDERTPCGCFIGRFKKRTPTAAIPARITIAKLPRQVLVCFSSTSHNVSYAKQLRPNNYAQTTMPKQLCPNNYAQTTMPKQLCPNNYGHHKRRADDVEMGNGNQTTSPPAEGRIKLFFHLFLRRHRCRPVISPAPIKIVKRCPPDGRRS